MNSYEKYYLEDLYPLQDGVMSIIQKLNTPFFLTGGTALSRHYFNHRYSDDLDLFVNSYNEFSVLVDKVLLSLESPEFQKAFHIEKESIKKFENYAQIFINDVQNQEIKLKIDFVNDISIHFGDFENNRQLGSIDSWRNILSNKLTALFRFEPKDIADIWVISSNKKFNWKEIINEAKSKEAGVEPDVIFNILKSFPAAQLKLIKWIGMPDYLKIENDLQIIAEDILYGNENSLTNLL